MHRSSSVLCQPSFRAVAALGMTLFPASASAIPDAIREAIIAGPDPASLAHFHEVAASEPHDAGTPGDARMIEHLGSWFESFGLEVETQELYLYLSTPVSASVSILPADPASEPVELPIREAPVAGDPFSAQDDLRPGWNAYAGTGVVEAEIVYANYGRLEDFEQLKAMGVETEGRILLARYGGNYRGYKAKYAEEAGAAGLIIYTDPADSGWGRGLPYPEGGYANETHIQRGSIKTLPYYGDPLTPFIEATEDAERLDPAEVGLPTIPVQPVPWKAAEQILSRMTGAEVPGGWQGGLPMRYRLTGGRDLRVKLEVEQTRDIVKTANVLGTLRGSEFPDEAVIIGCHHDAWGFGAGDPTAGLICVIEAARVFGELAQNGWRPKRSIVFAGWAAEEHGIVGSVEYVESRPEWLRDTAVAYLNLDMAAMGTNFGSSASPSLRPAIMRAASMLEQPGEPGSTVLEHWLDRTGDPAMPGMPRFGHLGGGSDHVGFLCHVCVPSASLGGGGARGVSYHSLYDNLNWYRAVVGEDYASARMVTQMALLTSAMLADAPVPEIDPMMYADAVIDQLSSIESTAEGDWFDVFFQTHPSVVAAARRFSLAAIELRQAALRSESGPELTVDERASINRMIREIERSWCDESFDDGRPWYRNGFAAPDATSGYAAWILPGLRSAIQDGDATRYIEQTRAYTGWFDAQTERLRSVLE